MTPERREQLEMAGWAWAELPTTSNVCYRSSIWTDEEAEAFKSGFEGARELYASRRGVEPDGGPSTADGIMPAMPNTWSEWDD